MAAVLRQLPQGEVRRSSTHDRLPGILEEEVKVAVTVRTLPEEARVFIDLRDNIDCVPCGLNVSEACVRTSAMIGVFNSIRSDIPKNAGSFRRIGMALREGCIVGIPSHPYSCSAATTNVSDRIANAVQCAFAELADGYGMAEIGANLPACRGVFSGYDSRSRSRFVNQVFLGASGGGAVAGTDCWLNYSHAGNGGMGFLDSVELAELYQPIKVHRRMLLPDTEGAGRQRGAPGKYVEISAVDNAVNVAFVTDGIHNPPRGVRGGGSGGAAKQVLRDERGSERELPACTILNLEPGQRLLSTTCGGGGYGRPWQRDPTRVRKDVSEGWVSVRRAAEVYGVELDANGDIDVQRTQKRRAEMGKNDDR
jgi:N-methylhydantoinase B